MIERVDVIVGQEQAITDTRPPWWVTEVTMVNNLADMSCYTGIAWAAQPGATGL